MISQHDKPKRWRPRFSVRTLVIAVTLVCCYAACWGPTKRRGIEDVQDRIIGREPSFFNAMDGLFIKYYSPVPLIVAADHLLFGKRVYYFWFFGFVAKLPLEREVDVIPTSPLDFRQAGRASKSFRDLPRFRDLPSTCSPFWIALVCRCVDS